MATTLSFRFTLGRYHATPWGHHVNEGLVEWPPSPWRILRTLVSVRRTRHPGMEEAMVRGILDVLAEPPVYFVPRTRSGHTRHYLPNENRRTGAAGSTDLTLDSFLAIDRESSLIVRWSGSLGEPEREALAGLAASIPYLGRADSLCEAVLESGEDGHVCAGSSCHCILAPLDVDSGEPGAPGGGTVRLLAPAFPFDPAGLEQTTVGIRGDGRMVPKGTRLVPYPAIRSALGTPERRLGRGSGRARSTAVVMGLSAPALPAYTDSVHLTNRLRSAAVKKVTEISGVTGASLLAGKALDGSPLRGHRHAHYLAIPDAARRRVRALAVWCPDGLDDTEVEAVARVTRLYGPVDVPGPPTVSVRVTGVGTAEELLRPLLGPSRVWESLTPFVAPRHRKGDADAFLAAEVCRELDSRGLPRPVGIDRSQSATWLQFHRRRGTRGDAGPNPPAGLRLVFEEPVAGPLALGHLAHFGVGLFVPNGA